jgi:hypothetical protein
MVLTYWEGEGIQLDSKEEPVYCKLCKKRASHRDTQLCGFHHKFNDEDLKVKRKPQYITSVTVDKDGKKSFTKMVLFGPNPKDFNKLSNYWLHPMK